MGKWGMVNPTPLIHPSFPLREGRRGRGREQTPHAQHEDHREAVCSLRKERKDSERKRRVLIEKLIWILSLKFCRPVIYIAR